MRMCGGVVVVIAVAVRLMPSRSSCCFSSVAVAVVEVDEYVTGFRLMLSCWGNVVDNAVGVVEVVVVNLCR